MFLVILTLLVNSNWQNRHRRKSRKEISLSKSVSGLSRVPLRGQRGTSPCFPHAQTHGSLGACLPPWVFLARFAVRAKARCVKHNQAYPSCQACQDPACNRPTLTGLEVRFQRHGADLQKASCATLRWPAPSRQRFLTPLPPARSSYLPIQCAWHALAMQASWQIAA